MGIGKDQRGECPEEERQEGLSSKTRKGMFKQTNKNTKNGQQGMPVIPALWTLKQEDHEFKAA